jgi:hypothetical protein
MDLNLFFSDGAGQVARVAATKAKAICAGCPVRRACLADAYAVFDDYGVRGGMTGRERKDARPAQIAACGTRSGYYRHKRLNEDVCAECRKANSHKNRVAA